MSGTSESSPIKTPEDRCFERSSGSSARRRSLAVLLSAAALVLGACSTKAPRFEVTSVAVTDQTEEGVVVTFRVAAENRNPEPLPLHTVRYALSLDGREVFRGERSAETTLRRFGTQEFLLPVSIGVGEGRTLSEQPGGQIPYSFSASVEYQTPGTIAEALFDSRIRIPTESFSERGKLDFAQAGPLSGEVP